MPFVTFLEGLMFLTMAEPIIIINLFAKVLFIIVILIIYVIVLYFWCKDTKNVVRDYSNVYTQKTVVS